jgi:hypothetical protein
MNHSGRGRAHMDKGKAARVHSQQVGRKNTRIIIVQVDQEQD